MAEPQFSARFFYDYPKLNEGGEPTTIDASRRPEVEAINRCWNHALIADDAMRTEIWRPLAPGDHAACTQFCATKLKALLDAGFPRSALALIQVRDTRDDRDEYHLILGVNFSTGEEVLDNLDDQLRTLAYDDTYTVVQREAYGNPGEWREP